MLPDFILVRDGISLGYVKMGLSPPIKYVFCVGNVGMWFISLLKLYFQNLKSHEVVFKFQFVTCIMHLDLIKNIPHLQSNSCFYIYVYIY